MLPVGREPVVAEPATPGVGEPQLVTHKTSRNACIATTIALVALLAAAPIAAADDPEVGDDGSFRSGECLYLDPWSVPPGWFVSVEDCIDEF